MLDVVQFIRMWIHVLLSSIVGKHLLFAIGTTFAAAVSFAAGAATMGAEGAPPSRADGDSLSMTSAAPAAIITRILDKWQPVSSELRQDAAVWRAQFGAVLDRASLRTLLAIDAMEAKSAGVNRTLVQSYQRAFMMAVADAGAQLMSGALGKLTLKLGSPTSDLVFFPITPCRIVDTRNVGGPIAAGNQVNFYFYSDSGAFSWSAQGGDPGPSPTACPGSVLTSAGGTLGNVAPAAAAATVTAVNTTAAGNFVVWGGGPLNSIPNTSALNWNAAGAIIANTTVIPGGGRTGGNLDFTVRYNGPSGQANVVVDVVGYYVENAATPLDCTTVTASGSIAIGTGTDSSISLPACAGGYTRTGAYCNGGGNTGTSGIYLIETGPTACTFRNLGSSPVTGNAVSVCCRVPGR